MRNDAKYTSDNLRRQNYVAIKESEERNNAKMKGRRNNAAMEAVTLNQTY